jgi:hypothetical protein
MVPGENGQATLQLDHGWFLLNRNEQDRGREHFIRWYIEHAKPWLERRVELFVMVVVDFLSCECYSCYCTGIHWRKPSSSDL